MATVKYGLSKGEDYFDVTQAAGSAVTDEVEVTVEDSLNKEEVVAALTKIIEWVTREDAN